MEARVKLGSKNRITLPTAVLTMLGIERGDHLTLDVREGYAILKPAAIGYAERLRGLHSEIWEGVDAQDYVNQERDAWDDRLASN